MQHFWGYVALTVIVMAIIWLFFAIAGVAEGAWDTWRDQRVYRQYQRLLMRKNANLLIEAIANEDNPITCHMLHNALSATLVRYRTLA